MILDKFTGEGVKISPSAKIGNNVKIYQGASATTV